MDARWTDKSSLGLSSNWIRLRCLNRLHTSIQTHLVSFVRLAISWKNWSIVVAMNLAGDCYYSDWLSCNSVTESKKMEVVDAFRTVLLILWDGFLDLDFVHTEKSEWHLSPLKMLRFEREDSVDRQMKSSDRYCSLASLLRLTFNALTAKEVFTTNSYYGVIALRFISHAQSWQGYL